MSILQSWNEAFDHARARGLDVDEAIKYADSHFAEQDDGLTQDEHRDEKRAMHEGESLFGGLLP